MPLTTSESNEALLQTTVEPLHHSIGFRMICCCLNMFRTPIFKKLRKDGGGKLTSSVSSHDFRDAIMRYPSVGEVVDNSFRIHVRYWNRYRPPGKPIDDGEKVVISI